jgi:hypothetical protein
MVAVAAPHPFRYPQSFTRRHGPSGYDSHRSYRPWVRDDFTFRCAYCLARETWARTLGAFDLDHFEARSLREDLALAYDNLVYACHICNLSKGTSAIAIPTAASLTVAADGTISARDDVGQRVIDMLSLDDASSTRWRQMVIGVVRSTFSNPNEQATFNLYMGFPTHDLPDLSTLRCPVNSRPDGVNDSWHARHARGDLPAYYE